MRVRSNVLNGYSAQSLDTAGGVLTLPLILTDVPPTNPLEAVSKKYVDGLLSQINISNIIGVFLPERMPSLSGTEVTSSGNATMTLSGTGVTPGTYTKVTVNASGRVTAGSNVNIADIPSFSWTKITSGKPTTLAGYGITDAMSVNSASFVGSLLLTNIPSHPLHAATKQYVDDKVSQMSETQTGYQAGFILRKSVSSTPVGFLRCNGGSANKVDYPDLYAAIGDQYGTGTGTNFFLPNLTAQDTPGGYWYIKY